MTKAFLEHKFSNLIIAAARFSIDERGDIWLDALIKTLAVGTALEIDLDSGPTVSPPSPDFSDLLTPFLHFLKLEIVQEMWSWNSSRAKGASNWWEVHADFAHLCDLDNLLFGMFFGSTLAAWTMETLMAARRARHEVMNFIVAVVYSKIEKFDSRVKVAVV